MKYSNCCDAIVHDDSDICSKCLEHCDAIGICEDCGEWEDECTCDDFMDKVDRDYALKIDK